MSADKKNAEDSEGEECAEGRLNRIKGLFLSAPFAPSETSAFGFRIR
jgi:hypothetical protein